MYSAPCFSRPLFSPGLLPVAPNRGRHPYHRSPLTARLQLWMYARLFGVSISEAMSKPSLWITLMAIFAGNNAMALEEPEFEVIAEFDEFEVRHYEPYLVAEVDVASGNSAFRMLAGYIFGDNSDSTKMEMTAPVESRPAERGDLETYSFVMEKKFTLDTLPEPNDKNIRVLERPARIVAARRFSGRWTEANFRRHLAALRTALADNNIEAAGPAEQARYNSPFTLPFLRRNEVIVPIVWPEPR